MFDWVALLLIAYTIIGFASAIYNIYCEITVVKTNFNINKKGQAATEEYIVQNNKLNIWVFITRKLCKGKEITLKSAMKWLACIILVFIYLCIRSAIATLFITMGLMQVNDAVESVPILMSTVLHDNEGCTCYAKCTGDPEDDKYTAYELIFGPTEYEKLIKDMLYTCSPDDKDLFETLDAGDSGAAKSLFIQMHINEAMVADYRDAIGNNRGFKHNDGIYRCDLDMDALRYDLTQLFNDVKTNGRNINCECCKDVNEAYLYLKCEGMPHWKPGWSWEALARQEQDNQIVTADGTLSEYMTVNGISGYLWKPGNINSNTALIWCMPGMSREERTVERNAAFISVKDGYVKPLNAVFFVDYTTQTDGTYKGAEVTTEATLNAIETLRSNYLSGIGDKLYYYGFSQGAWLYGDGGFSALGFSEVILGDGGDPQTIQLGSLQRALVTQFVENHIDGYNNVFSSLGDNYIMVNMRDITTSHATANYYTASNDANTFKAITPFFFYNSNLPDPSYGLTWFTEPSTSGGGNLSGDYTFTASDQELIEFFKSLGFSQRKSEGLTACFKVCTEQGMTAYEAIGLIACGTCEGEPGLVQYGYPTNTALGSDSSGLLYKSLATNHLYIDSLDKRNALAAVQNNSDNMGIGTAQWTNGRCANYLALMQSYFGDQETYSETDLFNLDYAMYTSELGPGGGYHALINNIKNHNSSLEAIVVYSMFYYEAGFGNYKNSDVIADYYDASKADGGWKYKALNNRYANAQLIDAAFKDYFGTTTGGTGGPAGGDLTDACRAICQSYITNIPSGQKIYVSGASAPSAGIPYSTFTFTYNGTTTNVQPYCWNTDSGPWYRCCNGLASAVLSIHRGQTRVTYLSCADLANGGTTISNNNQATTWGDLQPGDIIGIQYDHSGFGHVEVVLKNDGVNVYVGNAGSDSGMKNGAQNGYSSSHPVSGSVVKYYLDNYHYTSSNGVNHTCTFVKIARYN